jgi:Trypsin-like peptidase domain
MPMPINIDPYSATVSLLRMMFDTTHLSNGTCFFWERNGSKFLVTNWHNLSGINALTGEHMSGHAGEPDCIQIDTFLNQNPNNRGLASILLNDDAGPVWLQHPMHGGQIDVACLRLSDDVAPHVFAINEIQHPRPITRIADDVFLIGYPLAISVDNLPIWKRATVASEIDIDVDGLPKFYVDTASTKGMSGSPAIRRSMSGVTEDGSTYDNGLPMTKFLGVYSGRVSPNGDASAQIGIVWKAKVIDEIIVGQVRGNKH